MNLNPSQNGAVHAPEHWNLILAGPGSGKTRVQIARAVELRARGVAPASMAFVTFTNAAARVLRQRLNDSIGPVGFVGTLHAMMLAHLRRANPRLVMVPEETADEILMEHARKLGYKGTLDSLAPARRDHRPPARLIMQAEERVVAAYRRAMLDDHLLDFDMVLIEGLRSLATRPVPYSAVFVDEFQDSARADAAIYLAMSPEFLTITGDCDQCIYAFRGARPENVTDFLNDPRFGIHLLAENYRCGPRICAAANSVIRLNVDRVKKETVSAVPSNDTVSCKVCTDGRDEATAITSSVRALLDSGMPAAEIAVLTRTNALAQSIRCQLEAEKIPVAQTEGERMPKDWRLLTLLLGQARSPENWAGARLLAREIARFAKQDATAADRAVIVARDAGVSPRELFPFPAATAILSCNGDFTRYGVSRRTHELLADRIRLFEPKTLDELIETMREDPTRRHVDGVTVCTVHAAKGEEWRAVFVAGADAFCDEEEDRRVFFVAVTRAMSHLYVTAALHREVKLPTGMKIIETEPGNCFMAVDQVVREERTAA